MNKNFYIISKLHKNKIYILNSFYNKIKKYNLKYRLTYKIMKFIQISLCLIYNSLSSFINVLTPLIIIFTNSTSL
jgi:hypothetical protein